MSASPVIAVIGAGFSGSMLAVGLARTPGKPLQVDLYDAQSGFARGLAYGTRESSHLLNVPTRRMGAFPDRLEDFYDWLGKNEAQWRARHPALKQWMPEPDSFAPRLLYGDYVASLLAQAREHPSTVRLKQIAAEVIDAEVTPEAISLTRADGETRQADLLVLATGNLPARPPAITGALGEPARFINHIWAPPADSILKRTGFTTADAPVLIIGTGLTMVDALLSLRRRGYEGLVIAVSRHGLLPQPHRLGLDAYPAFLKAKSAPRNACGLMKAIHEEVRKAKRQGTDWRAVVDALRSDTPALWGQLPEPEKKKLQRLLSFWNVHRHRMPPESEEMLAREEAAGSLRVMAAGVVSLESKEHCIVVTLRTPEGRKMLEAGHVLNCAGPESDLTRAGSPLLRSLLAKGLARRGPLGLGLAADANGEVKGKGQGRIFALGPLLTGERLETIAVPELRAQAQSLARHLARLWG